ncbi:MAG: hypothetical protein SGJ27_31620 [Candidatus Melainabacteria bacterium]|nr:hypothetical protein [Candidatus Melainabacteria bacterium]
MTQVVNSARTIALLLGCLLIMQSVLPFAVLAASEARDDSGINEAADILGVRNNVDRIRALQAAGDATSEELLRNKGFVLKKLLLGYLEVRQTSDLLDEAIDDTYDAIDKQVRKVNRRVELANTVNFTTFGVLFNIAAADRLRGDFKSSNALTFVGAGLTAGLGVLAVGLSYTGASIDRCRPNPLANVLGLEKASVQLPELVTRYINATPNGSTQSRKAAMLDMWKSEFGLKESTASREILAAESTKRHRVSTGLLNQRLALLFSLNALAEQFDSELLALLRTIESTSSATNGSSLAVTSHIAASGIEAAKLLHVEQCAADIINMKMAGPRNGADLRTLALDVYMLEKILGAAFEVRQVVDCIDRDKHYQFDVLLPQLVRVRDRVNLLSNTATFTEIGVLKSIAGVDFVRNKTAAGAKKIMIMDAIAVAISTANFAYLKLYRHKQVSEVNVLANIFNFDAPGDSRFSPLITSYLDSVPPDSANGMTRRQQLLDHWKQIGRLSSKKGSAEALASLPGMHNKRVETIELVNKRVEMLFDVSGTVEMLDTELLNLLNAVILPAPENSADNEIDKQLAMTKRVMQNALEVRSASDQIDNQLSQEYTAKGAILASRDRGIQYNNILNFTQSGLLGIVSQGLVLDQKNLQANTLDLVAGSTLLLLSSASLVQARIGRRPSKPELNVLAHILVPNASTRESIPPSVRQYLNSPATESGLTRREALIERWRKSGVITANLKSERNLGKLSASAETSRRERVQFITDRIVMLHDVKTTIESMDKQLVRTLREERPSSVEPQ